MLDQFLSLIGFVVGLLIGLTGAGGGAILTPVLLLLGVPAATAVGSDLFFNGTVKALGSFLHYKHRNTDGYILLPLLLGSIPAIILGYWLFAILRATYDSLSLDHSLTLAIGVVLLTAGTVVFVGRKRRGNAAGSYPGFWRTAAVGAGIGIVVQMTSVGSGTMLLPYLASTGLAPRKVVGTDVVYGLVVSLLAGFSHLALGNVRLLLLAYLLIGALPGTLLGVTLTSKVNGSALRSGIGFLVVASGITLLLKPFL